MKYMGKMKYNDITRDLSDKHLITANFFIFLTN